MRQSLPAVQRFPALRRTVVRRQRLAAVLGLTLAAVQLSEARPAVALAVLGTVELGCSQSAVFAEDALCTPLLEIHVDVLSVILPLVLLGVSYQVLMREEGEFLLAGGGVDRVVVGVVQEEVFWREGGLAQGRQDLKYCYFEEEHAVSLLVLGVGGLFADPAGPEREVALEAALDAVEGGRVHVGGVDCGFDLEVVVEGGGEEGSAFAEGEQLDVGVGEQHLQAEGGVDPLAGVGLHCFLHSFVKLNMNHHASSPRLSGSSFPSVRSLMLGL
jgi:hypothetical protein